MTFDCQYSATMVAIYGVLDDFVSVICIRPIRLSCSVMVSVTFINHKLFDFRDKSVCIMKRSVKCR